jgi:DNA-nicking Smr family endonuclease
MADDFKKTLKILHKTAPKSIEPQIDKPQKNVPSEPSFKEMVGKVTPLKPNNQYQHPKPKTSIKKRNQTDRLPEETFYISDYHNEAPNQHSKNGQGKNDLKKLLTGYYPVVATLDLHGQTQESAQKELSGFINRVKQKGVCVRIIHGSGLGSSNFIPVLKNTTRHWLIQHPDVLAYTEEHQSNDGSVLVLLKKDRTES